MGMTMTQKILADHAGLESVGAGQLIKAKLDIVLGNDITTAVAIPEFEKTGATDVYDKEKVVIVLDHFTPNKDIKAAEQCKFSREFAFKHDIKHFYDVGDMGIEHVILHEKGIVAPGEVIIGADSHTCTYGALGAFSTGIGSTDMAIGMATGEGWFKVPSAIKFILTGKPAKWICGKDIILHIIGLIGVDGALYKSMEFVGDGIEHLSMDDRFTICNMAIEAGGKNGIFPADKTAVEYAKAHTQKEFKIYKADDDAEYDEVYTIDLSALEPTVAFPHLPENAKTIAETDAMKIEIHQAVIGSCTNGRLEDMKITADILRGKKVDRRVRTIVIPGSQQVYLDCIRLGYAEDIVRAGAVFSTPTCGPCLGGHMGILAAGERAISTTNRNFVGRMGHTESEVYLSSPAIAAASALVGYIADPEKIVGGAK